MAESEVKAKVTVEKGGETGAFAETAAEVRDLGSAAAAVAPPVEALGDKLDDVGESATEAGNRLDKDLAGVFKDGEFVRAKDQVEGVGDAAASTSNKMGAGVASVHAYFEAFRAGYTIGLQLWPVLDQLADGGITRVTQAALQGFGPTKALLDLLDGAPAPVLNTEAAFRVLRENGIDPTGLSADQLQRALDEVNKKFAEQKGAAAANVAELTAQNKAYQDWVDKLGLAKPKLAEAATDFAGFVQRFVAENGKLAALPDPISKAVQQWLTVLRSAGAEVPPELAKIAAQFGIVEAAEVRAGEGAKRFGADLQAALTGRAEMVKAELSQILAGIPEALAKQPPLRFLPPEQLEQARANLQQLVDATRAAGQQIPAALAEAAGQVGILVGEYETAGQSTTIFAQGTRAASDSMRVVRDEAGNLVGMISDLGTTSANSAGQIAGVGTAVDGAAKQVGTAAGEFAAAGEKVGESTKKLEGQAEAASGAATDLSGATTATTALAGEQDKAGSSVKTATDRLGELEVKVKELATTLEAASGKPVPAPDFSAWHAEVDAAMAKLNAFIALAQTAASLDLDGGGGAPA